MSTTVPIAGIGTQFTGTQYTGGVVVSPTFAINTHVNSVTYSGPEVVPVTDFGAYEIRGTVSGICWRGVSSVPRARNKHYAYNIPFVARWPKRTTNGQSGRTEDVVTFHHGGSPTVTQVVARDKLVGAKNNHRFGELSGDRTHGFPTLLNDCAYI